jgi:hypothetical protein
MTPAPKRPRPAVLRLSPDRRFWEAEGVRVNSPEAGLRRILGLADCGPQPGNREPKSKTRAAGAR